MPRLLQVCNIGQIVGGTAACAWSVTKALPCWDHLVVFLSPIRSKTKIVFADCEIQHWSQVSDERVVSNDANYVLLHNIPCHRIDSELSPVTIQYLHSQIRPAMADATMYCSRWLADRYGVSHEEVCYQGVPRAVANCGGNDTRVLRDELVVGRICTPQAKKWPDCMPNFYSELVQAFPQIRWEFVGCPQRLRERVQTACRGRAKFLEAGWQQRSVMWSWDALLYHNATVTESFGRTVAEAMRVGCIPIVDRQGGFCEQIGERDGFLCDGKQDFVRALAAIHDPLVRRARARSCRAHADKRFSLRRFSEELTTRFQIAEKAAHRCERSVVPL